MSTRSVAIELVPTKAEAHLRKHGAGFARTVQVLYELAALMIEDPDAGDGFPRGNSILRLLLRCGVPVHHAHEAVHQLVARASQAASRGQERPIDIAFAMQRDGLVPGKLPPQAQQTDDRSRGQDRQPGNDEPVVEPGLQASGIGRYGEERGHEDVGNRRLLEGPASADRYQCSGRKFLSIHYAKATAPKRRNSFTIRFGVTAALDVRQRATSCHNGQPASNGRLEPRAISGETSSAWFDPRS